MSEAAITCFDNLADHPVKFPGTPRRSANPPSGLDKTPRHAQGDINSANTTSSGQNASPGSLLSPQRNDKFQTNLRQPTSPDAETVMAALQRCSHAAAERRRIRNTLANNTNQTGQINRQSSLSNVGVHPFNTGFPLHAGFNPKAYGFNAGLPSALLSSPHNRSPRGQDKRSGSTPQSAGKSTHSSRSGRQNDRYNISPNMSNGSVRQNNYHSSFGYYRGLLTELNGLDNHLRWGNTEFVPHHSRRLLLQEIHRLENQYKVEESHQMMHPFANMVNPQASVLETIGRPPLRVPAAMLTRTQPTSHNITDEQTKNEKPQAQETSDVDTDSDSETDSSDISSVDCDTAVEPSDSDYKALLNAPATPENPPLKHNSTPMGDVKGHSTPKSSHDTPQRSSPNTSNSKLEPIMEVTEMPELKIFYLNELPSDLIQMFRGVQPYQFKCAKLFIPNIGRYNFIGRIIGPRGMSIRRLEAETGCKILIRGKGSCKDNTREEHLLNKEGWSHLKENLHVLVVTNDFDNIKCQERLENAVQSVRRLLTPQYDEYKRQQLMQLAIINGTYRP